MSTAPSATPGRKRSDTSIPADQVCALYRDLKLKIEYRPTDTLKAYASDPFHKEWMAAYGKVRVEGTTTFDILGQ